MGLSDDAVGHQCAASWRCGPPSSRECFLVRAAPMSSFPSLIRPRRPGGPRRWFLAAILSTLAGGHTLAAGIVDTLSFGNAAAEEAHHLAADRSDTVKGLLDEPARRLLAPEEADWQGGRVAFTMQVDPDKPTYFTIRLSARTAVRTGSSSIARASRSATGTWATSTCSTVRTARPASSGGSFTKPPRCRRP